MPIAKVQMPDGRIARFEVPEGTTPEQVMAFARENPPPPAAAPDSASGTGQPYSELDGLKAFTKSYVGPAVWDWGEEALHDAGQIGSGFTRRAAHFADLPGRAVLALLPGVDAPDKGYFETGAAKLGLTSAPVTESDKVLQSIGGGAGDAAQVVIPAAGVAKLAEVGARAVGAVPYVGKLVRGTGKLANALKAQPVAQAVAGGTAGAVTEATDNPYLGFAASLAVPAGVGLASANTARRARNAFARSAPTTDELKALSQGAYGRAEASTAVVSKASRDALVSRLRDSGRAEHLDPVLHPKAARVVKTTDRLLPEEPTLSDLTLLRRRIGIAAASREPDERRIASALRDNLDDYLEGLTARDLAAGDLGTAVADLKMARSLWRRMAKSKTLDKANERAQTQASGVENGLRTQFRQLLNNEAKMRNFSPGERAAIKAVADGTATRNTLRKLGKLGFGSGVQTNMLGGTASTSGASGVGYLLGGPVGAVIGAAAPGVVGGIAQPAAQRLAQRAADLARAQAATGRVLPAPRPTGAIPLSLATFLGQMGGGSTGGAQ